MVIRKTNDPTFSPEVHARLQRGSQETRRASVAISGPIVGDQVAARFSFDTQHYDGDVVEVTTGIAQEFQEAKTFRGKLLIEPEAIPRLSLKLSAEKVETEFGEFNTIFAPVSYDDPTFASFDPYGGKTYTQIRFEQPETTRYIADIEYEVNDNWRLVAIGTYEDHLRDRQFVLPVGGTASLIDAPAETETLSTELRFHFDYDSLSGWIGGYYFEEEELLEQNINITLASVSIPTVPAGGVISSVTSQTTTTENHAIFGELNYAINDHWGLILGARYDHEDYGDTGNVGTVSATPGCVINPVVPGLGGLPCAVTFPSSNTPGAPASFNAFLPRAGVTYNFDDKRSLTFSVEEGYRSGGSLLRTASQTPPVFEVSPFDPEYVTNYEMAFRSEWLDNKLTMNANVFFTEYTDMQVNIPGASGSGFDRIVVNAGQSELYGLELMTDYQFSSRLELYGSLGLLKTEFTDFEYADVGPYANLKGNELPTAPKVTVALGVNYEHPQWFLH